jgi:hypothetical protein
VSVVGREFYVSISGDELMNESDYQVIFPEHFEPSSLTAMEIEAKGVFGDVEIETSVGTYRPLFYDAVRLAQDAEAELEDGATCFSPGNIVIVKTVTRREMDAAIVDLARDNFSTLIADIKR